MDSFVQTFTLVCSIVTMITAFLLAVVSIKTKKYWFLLLAIQLFLLSIGHFFSKWIATPIYVISIVFGITLMVLMFKTDKWLK